MSDSTRTINLKFLVQGQELEKIKAVIEDIKNRLKTIEKTLNINANVKTTGIKEAQKQKNKLAKPLLIRLRVGGMNTLKSAAKLASGITRQGALGLGGGSLLYGGVFAGVVALEGAVKQTTDAFTKLQIGANQTGLSIGEWIKLSLPFEKMGLQAFELMKMIQDLSEKISDGAVGTKTYADALNVIGINANKVKNLKPAEMFREITKAMVDSNLDTADLSRSFADLITGEWTLVKDVIERVRDSGLSFEEYVKKNNINLDRLANNFTNFNKKHKKDILAIQSLLAANQKQREFMRFKNLIDNKPILDEFLKAVIKLEEGFIAISKIAISAIAKFTPYIAGLFDSIKAIIEDIKEDWKIITTHMEDDDKIVGYLKAKFKQFFAWLKEQFKLLGEEIGIWIGKVILKALFSVFTLKGIIKGLNYKQKKEFNPITQKYEDKKLTRNERTLQGLYAGVGTGAIVGTFDFENMIRLIITTILTGILAAVTAFFTRNVGTVALITGTFATFFNEISLAVVDMIKGVLGLGKSKAEKGLELQTKQLQEQIKERDKLVEKYNRLKPITRDPAILDFLEKEIKIMDTIISNKISLIKEFYKDVLNIKPLQKEEKEEEPFIHKEEKFFPDRKPAYTDENKREELDRMLNPTDDDFVNPFLFRHMKLATEEAYKKIKEMIDKINSAFDNTFKQLIDDFTAGTKNMWENFKNTAIKNITAILNDIAFDMLKKALYSMMGIGSEGIGGFVMNKLGTPKATIDNAISPGAISPTSNISSVNIPNYSQQALAMSGQNKQQNQEAKATINNTYNITNTDPNQVMKILYDRSDDLKAIVGGV